MQRRTRCCALLVCVASASGLLHHMQARLRTMCALRPRAAPSSGFGADQCRVSGGGLDWQHASAALAVPAGAPPPPKRSKQPYFEGWAVRVVDATLGVVMVIIGSFRAPGSAAFSSHLLVLQHHPTGARDGRVSQLLLGGEAVRIESGASAYPLIGPRGRRPPNFAWRIVSGPSRGGFMQVNGSAARLRFATPALAVELGTSGRTPWDPRRPEVGPEGWMRHLGALLPCRYFVHSLGSRATVTVTRPARAARALGARARAAPDVLRTADGLAHMEGNYGRVFPEGWVWLNSISRAEGASVLAVGGRFQIGVASPQTYLLAFRDGARALAWDFRTTDGDRVREERAACNGTLQLDARSRDGRRRLLLSAAAAPSSFGPRIYVPTAAGFENAPGCAEAHGATVRVRAYEREARREAADAVVAHGARWRLVGSHTLGQSALEFGGAHACGSVAAARLAAPAPL